MLTRPDPNSCVSPNDRDADAVISSRSDGNNAVYYCIRLVVVCGGANRTHAKWTISLSWHEQPRCHGANNVRRATSPASDRDRYSHLGTPFKCVLAFLKIFVMEWLFRNTSRGSNSHRHHSRFLYPDMRTMLMTLYFQRPEECPQRLYDTILKCWDKDPASRPSFKGATILLRHMLDDMRNNPMFMAAQVQRLSAIERNARLSDASQTNVYVDLLLQPNDI